MFSFLNGTFCQAVGTRVVRARSGVADIKLTCECLESCTVERRAVVTAQFGGNAMCREDFGTCVDYSSSGSPIKLANLEEK